MGERGVDQKLTFYYKLTYYYYIWGGGRINYYNQSPKPDLVLLPFPSPLPLSVMFFCIAGMGPLHLYREGRLHESICPPQPARCAFSLPLGCHPVRPSAIYTVCPILESVAYCHHRSHCKGIPPNAICIAPSSIGSWVPATEPRWQIKWARRWGLNPHLQHSRLTC